MNKFSIPQTLSSNPSLDPKMICAHSHIVTYLYLILSAHNKTAIFALRN